MATCHGVLQSWELGLENKKLVFVFGQISTKFAQLAITEVSSRMETFYSR